MAKVNVNYIIGILFVIVIVIGGATIKFQADKDKITLYRNDDVLGREKWIVSAERTWFALDSSYDRNVKCPKIEALGGYRTATRCYYPDNYFERLSRSLINTEINMIDTGDLTILEKITPVYKYGTRGSYAGLLTEWMQFDEEVLVETEFPKDYEVDWDPRDTRNYQLIWRVFDIKDINLADGEYLDCDYAFGNLKIDLEKDCSKLEKAEVKNDQIEFFFNKERGVQSFNPLFVDPDLSLRNVTGNISVELGAWVNISGSTASNSRVCIDVMGHPAYGANYSCANYTTSFVFNVTWFRNIYLNKTLKINGTNLTYAGADNITINIPAHQYDRVDNISINVTGFSSGGDLPTGVKLYINGTKINTLGTLFEGTGANVTDFSDTNITKNITVNPIGTIVAGYVRIPKSASVSSAKISLSGYRSPIFQNMSGGISLTSTGAVVPMGLATNKTNEVNPEFWVADPTGDGFIYHVSYTGTNLTDGFGMGTAQVDNPRGVALSSVDTWWVFDYDLNQMNELNVEGTHSDTFQVDGASLGGPAFNGTDFYLTESNNYIQHYGDDGTEMERLSPTSPNNMRGICTNASLSKVTDLWTVNSGDDTIKHYNITGSLKESFSTVAAGAAETYDCAVNTTDSSPLNFWITDYNDLFIYHFSKSFSLNPYIEVGLIDGTREWYHIGKFSNTANRTDDFSTAVNTFLATCVEDSEGYCLVPIYISSDRGGRIDIDDVVIEYTYGLNPVYLDRVVIRDFLRNSTNSTAIPITVESTGPGIIELADLRYDYAGGNYTYEIRAHNDTYVELDEWNVTFYYSNWDYVFPSNVDFLEFIPPTLTSKNVTPYGQTGSIPILNITAYNYESFAFNWSFLLNETQNTTTPDDSCVNISFSVTNNRGDGIDNMVNMTWYEIWNDLGYVNQSDGFSVSSVSLTPYGITSNGSDFYVVDNNNGDVYHFNSSGDYISEFISNTGVIRGITTNGSDFYVVSVSPDFLYHFNSSGDNQTDGFPLDINTAQGVVFNGSNFWIVDDSANKIFNYDIYGDKIIDYSISSIGISNPHGITSNGSDFWILDGDDSFIYHLNSSFINQTDGISISPFGIEDGTGLDFSERLTGGQPTNFWITDSTDDFAYHILPVTSGTNNKTYLDNFGVWMWADFNCNYTSWNLWEPELHFRGCATGAICSEVLT